MQASGDRQIEGAESDKCERNDDRRWNRQPIHTVKACEHGSVNREARRDHQTFMHIRPASEVDACHHETGEPYQGEEITDDFESQVRRNRPVRFLGSMNDHECADWNDQDPNERSPRHQDVDEDPCGGRRSKRFVPGPTRTTSSTRRRAHRDRSVSAEH